MKIKEFLNQPYPFPAKQWKTVISISLAIGIFMFMLQPFGLASVELKNKGLFLLGYSLATCIPLIINTFLLPYLFSEYSWTIVKQILWTSWVIFCLGLANYGYTALFFNAFHFSFNILLTFQVYTFFIGIIPVSILALVRQNRLLKINKDGAEVLNEGLNHPQVEFKPDEQLELLADNEKSKLALSVSDLAFIESVGNYIHVFHKRENELVQSVLRSSMVKAEAQINHHSTLIKCHRAFIVNLNYIEEIKGNAQGYRLKIKDSHHEVYVSRQYTKLLKSALN